MSVELSNKRTDLGALAKELDIPAAMLYRCEVNFQLNKT